MGLKTTNIPPTQITIFGRTLDTNGDLFIGLLDRQTNNITPVLATNYSNYIFTVTATKIKIVLTLRNSGNLTQRETNGIGYDAAICDAITNLVKTNVLGVVVTADGPFYNVEETSATVPTNTIFNSGLEWHRDIRDRTEFVVPGLPAQLLSTTNFISSPPGNGMGNDDGGGAGDSFPDTNRLILNVDAPALEFAQSIPLVVAPIGTIFVHRCYAREWLTFNGVTISEILRWKSSAAIRRKADLSWERIGGTTFNFIGLTPSGDLETPSITAAEWTALSGFP